MHGARTHPATAAAPAAAIPRRVALAQLSHPLNDRNPHFCNKENVPLAAGYLRAMARARGLDRALDISILDPDLLDHAGDCALVESLAEGEVDVLALSLYPWSAMRSLHLASRLRQLRPEVLLVAGGPEVNPARLPWLLGQGLVDVAIPGEGEVTFSETLTALIERKDLLDVPGVALRRDGAIAFAPARPTLVDLDAIPSPFLEGDIDLRAYRQVHVLFERGCIYACKFCHWWPDKRSHGRFSLGRLESELRLLRGTGVKEVILLDASINTSRHFAAVCDVLERVNGDRRLEIKVQVLFDHFTREQLERLARGGVRRLEIGLQSASPETLRRVQRPTEVARFEHAIALAEGLPLDLQIDFMLGLPGDTEASVAATAALIREVARRHRVTQVSPFVLSVGSASRLYLEAPSLGLRFQPEPPHRILALPGMDYAALRALRMRVPALLGARDHPAFEYDRPHYALNLFEPELSLDSAARPQLPERCDSLADPGGPIDALRLRCRGGAPGHPHPFDPRPVASRLAQVALVWHQTPDPHACLGHIAATLDLLTSANLYGVWDLVLECQQPIDLAVLDTIATAVRHRVNNLDWDGYLANPEEGPGHARLASRLLLLLPLGAAGAEWLAEASRKVPLVHTLRIAGAEEARTGLTAAAALPGEGVLVEVAAELEPAAVADLLEQLAGLERRVRGLRNLALKVRLERERARRNREPPPRIPYRDRLVLEVDADGGASWRPLSRRRAWLDLAEMSLAAESRERRAATGSPAAVTAATAHP